MFLFVCCLRVGVGRGVGPQHGLRGTRIARAIAIHIQDVGRTRIFVAARFTLYKPCQTKMTR